MRNNIRKSLVFSVMMTVASLLIGGVAFAQLPTDGTISGPGNQINDLEINQQGSTILGFNVGNNLLPAIVATDTLAGPCFTCPTINGSTAGSLTDSHQGVIRQNAGANLGDLAFNPISQGQSIPNEPIPGVNDSGPFVINTTTPEQNFLNTGTPVALPNPDVGEPVGKGGVKFTFDNVFTFNDDESSQFDQNVQQTTFVGGLLDDEVQITMFQADSMNPANATLAGVGGIINWSQDIVQGGFLLGPQAGSFTYNVGGFPSADHPTGPTQTTGTPNTLP